MRGAPLIFHRFCENGIDNVPHSDAVRGSHADRIEARNSHSFCRPSRTHEKQSKTSSIAESTAAAEWSIYRRRDNGRGSGNANWAIRASLWLCLQLGRYNEPLSRPLIFTFPRHPVRLGFIAAARLFHPLLHFQLKRRRDPVLLALTVFSGDSDNPRRRVPTTVRSRFHGVSE